MWKKSQIEVKEINGIEVKEINGSSGNWGTIGTVVNKDFIACCRLFFFSFCAGMQIVLSITMRYFESQRGEWGPVQDDWHLKISWTEAKCRAVKLSEWGDYYYKGLPCLLCVWQQGLLNWLNRVFLDLLNLELNFKPSYKLREHL